MSDSKATGGFEFIFDPSLEDPASFGQNEDMQDSPGPFLPNTEGRSEFLPPDPDKVPVIENAVDRDSPSYSARPAKDRTRELFSQMHAQRPILKRLIECARKPISTAQAEKSVEDIRSHRFSLYTTANLCSMLEQAGALECVDEQGSPYERKVGKPDIVVEDGEAYYQPADPPKIYWKSTPEGLAVAAEKDPVQRLAQTFEKEKGLLAIHKRVLEMCADSGGASVPNLSAAIDSNPLIADPRRFFVQHFIDELEAANAITWSGRSWVVTDIGKDALEKLADVKDDYVPESPGDGHTVATETDGVRW